MMHIINSSRRIKGGIQIVITGASGLLAQALLYTLKDRYKVNTYTHSQLDITNQEQVFSKLSRNKIDIIINAAACANVDYCENNPEIAYSINQAGPRNLALYCKEHKIKLIHFGTDYLFNDTAGKHYFKENDTLAPHSVYACTKLAGEQEIIRIGPDFLIIRVSWLFGPFKNNFVTWLIATLRSGKPAHVVCDQVSAPTYTIDTARAMIKLIEKNSSAIVHLRNNNECSRMQQAEYIAETACLDTKLLVPLPGHAIYQKAQRPHFSVMDISLLEQILGEKMRTWQETTEEFLNFSLNNDITTRHGFNKS